MGPQPHIMSLMSHSLQSRLFRPSVAFVWMVILKPSWLKDLVISFLIRSEVLPDTSLKTASPSSL